MPLVGQDDVRGVDWRTLMLLVVRLRKRLLNINEKIIEFKNKARSGGRKARSRDDERQRAARAILVFKLELTTNIVPVRIGVRTRATARAVLLLSSSRTTLCVNSSPKWT